MKAVATSTGLNQAVAEISADAFAFLCAIHNSEIDDVRVEADAQMHQLREFVRFTGARLDDLPAYRANTTSWGAIARLAGSNIDMKLQAG
jgi:hypothetical protein